MQDGQENRFKLAKSSTEVSYDSSEDPGRALWDGLCRDNHVGHGNSQGEHDICIQKREIPCYTRTGGQFQTLDGASHQPFAAVTTGLAFNMR